MPSYASIFIRSGVFMVALAGMSNSIVLPATVALEPGTHLAELIRDVFVTHGPGNGTAANKTPATANASSNSCGGRCVPALLSCAQPSYDDDGDDDIDGDGDHAADVAYDDAGDGFLDIRLAADGASHRRRFCAPPADKCCPNDAPKPIAPLAIRPMQPADGPQRSANACGISTATSDRVISDGTSEIDEFPWMAAVLWATPTGAIAYKCGSTLIHPSVVLTVAHCVHQTPAARLFVRVGQRDVRTDERRLVGRHDRRVRQVIVHEHFNSSRYSLHNDIALLFLDAPVWLSAAAAAVCLPTAGSTFDRRRCVVSGWGQPASATAVRGSSQRRTDRMRVLRKIQVPVVPRTLCERSLRTTRLGRRFRLHRSFVCAGGEPGRDACTGDGGSPLVCATEDAAGRVRYVQAGIVALGIGCGNNVPGVYVNVAEFRAWIDDQMLTNGYARTFYRVKLE